MASNNPEFQVFACERCQGAVENLCWGFTMGSVIEEDSIKELIGPEETLGSLSMRQVALKSCRTKLIHSLRIAGCQLPPEQIDHNVSLFRQALEQD